MFSWLTIQRCFVDLKFAILCWIYLYFDNFDHAKLGLCTSLESEIMPQILKPFGYLPKTAPFNRHPSEHKTVTKLMGFFFKSSCDWLLTILISSFFDYAWFSNKYMENCNFWASFRLSLQNCLTIGLHVVGSDGQTDVWLDLEWCNSFVIYYSRVGNTVQNLSFNMCRI